MLYDTRWDPKTKADPLSIDAFIAWLETKNPKATYNFSDCDGRCLIGQYMKAHGIDWDEGQPDYATLTDAFPMVAVSFPHTFGAALERARAIARR